MPSNGDMRFLVDWDKNGFCLVDPVYTEGAVNLIPGKFLSIGSGVGRIVTLNQISNDGYVIVTTAGGGIQNPGDELVFGTINDTDPDRWQVTPSVVMWFECRIKNVDGAGTNGVQSIIRQYTSGGSLISTSSATVTGAVATGATVNHSHNVLMASNVDYITVVFQEQTSFTNDAGEWEFSNIFYGHGTDAGLGLTNWVGGELSKYEDITSRVLSSDWSIGGNDVWQWLAPSGTGRIVIDNDDDLFSPEGTRSILAGRSINHAIAIVQVYSGGTWHTLYSGFIDNAEYNFPTTDIRTLTLNLTQGLEETQEVLWNMSAYRNAILPQGTSSGTVYYVSHELNGDDWVPPNLFFTGEVKQGFSSSTDDILTGATNVPGANSGFQIVPKHRSDGIPVYDMVTYLMKSCGRYGFIREDGYIHSKLRPDTGGTTLTIDLATEVNDYKYSFGDDFGRGILSTHNILGTTRASSSELLDSPVVGTIGPSTSTTKNYIIPEAGDYHNFSAKGTVTHNGGTDTLGGSTVATGNGGLIIPFTELDEGPATFNWNIAFTQTSPTNLEVVYSNNQVSGNVTFTITSITYGDATIESTQLITLDTTITDDVALFDIDLTKLPTAFTTTDIVDEISLEEGMIREITVANRDDTWLARIIDLLPGSDKIPVFNMGVVVPGSATLKRHHVTGYQGRWSPSEVLTCAFYTYRSSGDTRNPSNLIANWKLDEGFTGTPITDYSANEYDGAYIGVTWPGELSPFGKPAPLFDGSTSYGNLYNAGFSSAFDMDEGTASIWFKVANSGVWADGSNDYLLYLYRDVGNYIYLVKESFTGQMRVRRRANSNTDDVVISGMNDVGWVSAVITWSVADDKLEVFFNGQSTGSATSLLASTGSGLSSTLTLLGAASSTPGFPWQGYLAHLSVYDRALTLSEISALASI